MKKNKIIVASIIGITVLTGLLYLFGFIYGFKNYGNDGNWKPIKEYQFNASKPTVEQNIKNIVSANRSSIWFADSSYEFSEDGWYTAFIKTPADTVQYIYRFKGDSSSWMKESKSTILLFSITDKYNDITPTTIKSIKKEQIQKGVTLFESALLDQVN